MSYSRWSNSRWYTFWTCFSEQKRYKFPTKRLKGNQVFEICDDPSLFFTYKTITELGAESVLLEVRLTFPDATDAELEELWGYMERFVRDVDERFKFVKFFKYEWWYTFRNKLRIKWKKTKINK
jgi:hypothetical protein